MSDDKKEIKYPAIKAALFVCVSISAIGVAEFWPDSPKAICYGVAACASFMGLPYCMAALRRAGVVA